MTNLRETFAILVDLAKCEKRPMPVIQTDIHSAMALRKIIEAELGVRLANYPDCIVWFNDVKIITNRQNPDQAAFRDHFGILAEIWSDA